MRGQKRVQDARKRAYDPRIHLVRNKVFAKMMDCRVKPGNDGEPVIARRTAELTVEFDHINARRCVVSD
jgi:hypothetical protein